jgi:hypothetical protein
MGSAHAAIRGRCEASALSAAACTRHPLALDHSRKSVWPQPFALRSAQGTGVQLRALVESGNHLLVPGDRGSEYARHRPPQPVYVNA